VVTAAQRRRESLKSPAKTIDEHLDMLEKEGLAQATSILREFMIGE
jgi:hypothetical protein